jgi:hypothetical protein
VSPRTELIVLTAVVITLVLSNIVTLLTALALADEADRMVGEATHCYNAFNAVHAACLEAGACEGMVR